MRLHLLRGGGQVVQLDDELEQAEPFKKHVSRLQDNEHQLGVL